MAWTVQQTAVSACLRRYIRKAEVRKKWPRGYSEPTYSLHVSDEHRQVESHRQEPCI